MFRRDVLSPFQILPEDGVVTLLRNVAKPLLQESLFSTVTAAGWMVKVRVIYFVTASIPTDHSPPSCVERVFKHVKKIWRHKIFQIIVFLVMSTYRYVRYHNPHSEIYRRDSISITGTSEVRTVKFDAKEPF
jgi:hypothetical protein